MEKQDLLKCNNHYLVKYFFRPLVNPLYDRKNQSKVLFIVKDPVKKFIDKLTKHKLDFSYKVISIN
jgi:hypothetical protein